MAMVSIAELPRYESYKDSEMLWIDKLPAAWRLEKAKWLFKRVERSVRSIDEIVTCFRDGTVTLRSNRRTEGFTNALKEHGYQGVRKGDLVIHAMDAFAGAIGVSDSDGKATPVYAACVPRRENEVNPRFYAYYLRDMALSGFIASLAKGIRERSTDFRFNDFAELLLPIPDFGEQMLIVCFLDKKTTQIDEAIAIKEQQIALLKERKQIIIQKAVTQGLDPNVLMKDSGVDWIGKIPEHWEVIKLKHLFTEVTARTKTGTETLFSLRMEIGLVPHDDVSDKHIPSESLVDYKIVKSGQMVMNRMRAAIGIFGLATDYGLVSPDYAVFDVASDVVPDYYLTLFKLPLMGTQFRLASKGMGTGSSGFMRLYTDEFGDIKVANPPKEEQEALMRFIEETNRATDLGVDHLQSQIEKLKEYKTTLINSAVTGKIKVTPEMAGLCYNAQDAEEAPVE
ncbi:restriction endonuclease subunit S [Teredinibacter turnerae]|uniref:restriction endonuclease subunit S n=1 Tax=Teredinibacter turnerae TaxID=2426 RepID=UPI0003620C66|nr:restriction endonuclease subunit S [Teredinibacter turnerae]